MQFQVTILCLRIWAVIRGTWEPVPLVIGVGASMGLSPKICGICKHVEQVVLCLWFLGNLSPAHNPRARFKWAARQGGEGNVERGGREEEGKKGEGRETAAVSVN